jgi:hypothetical protein
VHFHDVSGGESGIGFVISLIAYPLLVTGLRLGNYLLY